MLQRRGLGDLWENLGARLILDDLSPEDLTPICFITSSSLTSDKDEITIIFSLPPSDLSGSSYIKKNRFLIALHVDVESVDNAARCLLALRDERAAAIFGNGLQNRILPVRLSLV